MFNDLSTTRPVGMSVGPIPYTAIIHYITFWGFDSVTSELLIDVVEELDSLYMKHINKGK